MSEMASETIQMTSTTESVTEIIATRTITTSTTEIIEEIENTELCISNGRDERREEAQITSTEFEFPPCDSTNTSITHDSSVLSTKELNRFISQTKLNESFVNTDDEDFKSEIFPLGMPKFGPVDPDKPPQYPLLVIDEGLISQTKPKKRANPESKVKLVASPTPANKNTKPNNCEPRRNANFSNKCNMNSPSRNARNPRSTPECERSNSELKTANLQEQRIETELVKDVKCGESSMEIVQSKLPPLQMELKSALKSPDRAPRPTSLQIPVDMEYELNTTEKGATKCPTAARKISFESPHSNEKQNFEKVLKTSKCKYSTKTSNIYNETERSPLPLLNESNKIVEEKSNPNPAISVACQTKPCIVTPISSIRNLSVSQNIHRRNLFLFSNQTPHFLRSTEASRGHSISPPKEIEGVKYLKEHSALISKRSPCTTPTTRPRKYILEAPASPAKKFAFGSPIPCSPATKNSNSSGKITAFSPTKLSPLNLRSTEVSGTGKTLHSPHKSYAHDNSGTYVSPTPLTSYSKYVDNLTTTNTKNTSARMLSPSKLMVTSIPPCTTSIGIGSKSLGKANNNFNRGSQRTSSGKSSSSCVMMTSVSSSYREGISPNQRRISESGMIKSEEKSRDQRFSLCNNMRTSSVGSSSSFSMSPGTPTTVL